MTIVLALANSMLLLQRPSGTPPDSALLALLTLSAAVAALSFVAWRREHNAATRRVAELERERGRIAAFIESAGEGLYAIDLDGRCVLVNQAAARWLGYSADEMIGKQMHHLIHHTHADGTPSAEETCTTARAFRGGEHVHVAEDVFWRRDGTSFPVEYRSSPIVEGGIVRGAVVSLADVSARVRAAAVQRFLDESGRALASTIEFDDTLATLARLAVPMVGDLCIIDIIDDDGFLTPTVAHVDDAAANAIREQRRNAPLHRDVDHPIVRALRDCASVAIDGAPDAGWNEPAPDAEGRRRSHFGICIPLAAREHTLGVVTFARIGRRFAPEDVALAHDLARRAAVAIDNARLYRDARAATNARDEVLAIVSHDLRNPVHTIGMGAQLMLETLPEADTTAAARRQIGIIRRAAQRANRLIADLLDVRRIETGRLAVDRKPVSVTTLLEDVLEMFAADAEERRVALEARAPSPAPVVFADRERMLQLFTNLVGNALKFTPAGGCVTVRADIVNDVVRCAVSDTGPGIPSDQLPHLFDRYWQARRNDRRGVGLGLSIAKGIAEAHGSALSVASEVGRGTTFTFSLPVAESAEPLPVSDEPAYRAGSVSDLVTRRQGPHASSYEESERV
jgi:PAS domain S-box-containing protein